MIDEQCQDELMGIVVISDKKEYTKYEYKFGYATPKKEGYKWDQWGEHAGDPEYGY